MPDVPPGRRACGLAGDAMWMVQAWDADGKAPAGWGSHIAITWSAFEPAAGVYRLDHFRRALECRERPCYVQLVFSMFNKATGVPEDYTPQHRKRSVPLTVGKRVGEIPSYDSIWREAYIRAVEALAAGLRDCKQVLGYWHAVGWNAETQIAAVSHTGDWGAAARPYVRQQDYYDFLTESTRRAVAAWGSVPVYLPGAPSPGGVWGTKRRDVVADCLKAGAGYMNCGLLADNSNSTGVGERAGLGMYDIGLLTERRGFEEGPRVNRAEPMELYWMLLRARHWRAEFVNLYRSQSIPDYERVAGLLPDPGARWIVFRDAEWPISVTSAGGKVYGHRGEVGPWAYGVTVTGALPGPNCGLARRSEGFGFDRWVLVSPGPLVLKVADLTGRCAVTIWRPNGRQESGFYQLFDGVDGASTLTLPAGEYHRVDVVGAPGEETLEDRLAALERRVQALERAA